MGVGEVDVVDVDRMFGFDFYYCVEYCGFERANGSRPLANRLFVGVDGSLPVIGPLPPPKLTPGQIYLLEAWVEEEVLEVLARQLVLLVRNSFLFFFTFFTF